MSDEIAAWSDEPPGVFGATLIAETLKLGDGLAAAWAQYTANEECGTRISVRDKQAVRAILAQMCLQAAEWHAEITADVEAKGGI